MKERKTKRRKLKATLDVAARGKEHITIETITHHGPPWDLKSGKFIQISIRVNADRLRMSDVVDLLSGLDADVVYKTKE